MTCSDPLDEDETERRFWRSLRARERAPASVLEQRSGTAPPEGGADDPPVEDAPSRERAVGSGTEARRLALRHLLQAAEARLDRAGRTRPPAFANGAVVRAVRGEAAGRTGIVLDADYIESRVLLDLGPDEPQRWVPFSHVGPVEPEG